MTLIIDPTSLHTSLDDSHKPAEHCVSQFSSNDEMIPLATHLAKYIMQSCTTKYFIHVPVSSCVFIWNLFLAILAVSISVVDLVVVVVMGSKVINIH